jgi:hypothetical protein
MRSKLFATTARTPSRRGPVVATVAGLADSA